MNTEALVRGAVVGFSIAAPVGPIGLLCIRRTLSGGLRSGLVSGLGAASADTCFGCLAAVGLTAVAGFLVDRQTPLQVAGGLFLLVLGVTICLSRPPESAPKVSATSLARDYASTFAYTLTNPMTILVFSAIIASLGDVSGGAAASLVAGVFVGSAAWWFILSSLVSLLRTSLRPVHLLWVNRIAGAAIFVYGITTVAGALV